MVEQLLLAAEAAPGAKQGPAARSSGKVAEEGSVEAVGPGVGVGIKIAPSLRGGPGRRRARTSRRVPWREGSAEPGLSGRAAACAEGGLTPFAGRRRPEGGGGGV